MLGRLFGPDTLELTVKKDSYFASIMTRTVRDIAISFECSKLDTTDGFCLSC